MNAKTRNKILNGTEIKAKVDRIAHQINENCYQEEKLVLVGITGRGYDFAKRLQKELQIIAAFEIALLQIDLDKDNPINNDITLKHPESIKNRAVILVDDVLNSGKTLAYAAAYLLQLDPKMIKTAILVNREHHRFPITADFVGISLATTLKEHIQVELGRSDGVYLV